MAERATKASLEAEIDKLREEIEELTSDREKERFVKTRSLLAMGGVTLIVVLMFLTSWLGLPSPFSTVDRWVVLGIAILFVFAFLMVNAMLLKKNMEINAEISDKKAKLAAIVSESKK